ncbi:MAG: hypothetical protein ACRCWJ_02015 [Casimicrobium sp.]
MNENAKRATPAIIVTIGFAVLGWSLNRNANMVDNQIIELKSQINQLSTTVQTLTIQVALSRPVNNPDRQYDR